MTDSEKFSRTCFECRRKSLKCDNARPQCLRCRKARRLCPGYPKTASQVQVDSTSWSVRTPQSLVVLASDSDTTPSFRAPTIQYASSQTRPAGVAWLDSFFTLRPTPSPALDDLVTPLFFRSCTTASQSSVGLLSFMPQMYARSAEGSCLRLAVDATAHANASHQLGVSDNMPLARTKYLAAIKAVQNALSNDKAIDDSTIFSLYVLNIFEFLSGDTATGSHIDGIEALLLLRAKLLERENDRIYQCVIVLVLVKHLRDEKPPPTELVALVKANSSNNPRSLWASHVLEVMQFRQQLSRIIDDKDNAVELFLQFTLGTRLRKRFKRWPETDDEFWHFTTVDKNLDPIQAPSHVYKDISLAVYWNSHRRVRITLLMILLHCGEKLLLTPYKNQVLEDMTLFRSEIAALFQDIVASYTYLLGGVDSERGLGRSGVVMGAYTLLWSIHLILRTDLATSKQKAASVAALEYMGYVLGLRRALDLKKLWTTGSS